MKKVFPMSLKPFRLELRIMLSVIVNEITQKKKHQIGRMASLIFESHFSNKKRDKIFNKILHTEK